MARSKYTAEQIEGGLSETSKSVNRLLITLLALGLLSLVSIGLSDVYLLDTAKTVNLPSVGAMSAKNLLIVGPLLLIGIRVYLQIYIEHWKYLDTIAEEQKLNRTIVVSHMPTFGTRT